MRKSGKKSYVLVALVVLLLAMAVGYALFSTTLKIEGTATAKGGWDVHFKTASATVTPANGESTATATKESDTKVTVDVALKKPGEKATVTTTIENTGSLDANLKGLTIKARDGKTATLTAAESSHTFGAIKATLNAANVATGSTLVKTNGTVDYTLTFEWPSDYDEQTTVDDEMGFEITLEYEQA